MEPGWIAGGGVAAAVFAAAGAWWAYRRRQRARQAAHEAARTVLDARQAADPAARAAAEAAPDELLIGESPERAVIAVTSADSRAGFEKAIKLDLKGEVMSRLSGLLQPATGVLTGRAAGKRFIQVVVRGDLTVPADGHGFRTFAMKGRKMLKDAVLWDARLQSMINAAAMWQVASVLVAQKHLADIGKDLHEIKSAVQGISQFLDQQRRARIQSTYDYLAQVARAIGAGAVSSSVRGELERCERDLLEIHRHLVAQFQSVARERVRHTETVGTRNLTRDIAEKIKKLDELATDMHMCLRTRIGAWHVLSAFPGETPLIKARREGIDASCEQMRDLGPFLSAEIEQDIGLVRSRLNRQATLDKRRAELRRKRDGAKRALAAKATQVVEAIEKTLDQLLLRDEPTRILVAVENGRIVGARQAVSRER